MGAYFDAASVPSESYAMEWRISPNSVAEKMFGGKLPEAGCDYVIRVVKVKGDKDRQDIFMDFVPTGQCAIAKDSWKVNEK